MKSTRRISRLGIIRSWPGSEIDADINRYRSLTPSKSQAFPGRLYSFGLPQKRPESINAA
jgi:hypothetical protein